MNEQDYWMNRANQDTINNSITPQAQLNYWADKQYMLPVEILKPAITKDGNQWSCLYGNNLQEGISGFGDTPNLAVLDFIKNYHSTN